MWECAGGIPQSQVTAQGEPSSPRLVSRRSTCTLALTRAGHMARAVSLLSQVRRRETVYVRHVWRVHGLTVGILDRIQHHACPAETGGLRSLFGSTAHL